MKRIGIAASKIAKDSLFRYNLYVILISLLFSVLVFCLSGFSIMIGLAIVSVVAKGFIVFEQGIAFIICLVTLSVVVGIMNLVAVLMNIRLR